MAELGRSALIIALGLELWALGAGSYAAWRGRRRLAASARNAIVGAFAATALATVVLLVAHLRRDFSFRYVAEHTSLALPDGYAAASLWSGQEGSLLLWLLILTALSAARDANCLERGALLLFVCASAGITAGACLYRG